MGRNLVILLFVVLKVKTAMFNPKILSSFTLLCCSKNCMTFFCSTKKKIFIYFFFSPYSDRQHNKEIHTVWNWQSLLSQLWSPYTVTHMKTWIWLKQWNGSSDRCFLFFFLCASFVEWMLRCGRGFQKHDEHQFESVLHTSAESWPTLHWMIQLQMNCSQ